MSDEKRPVFGKTMGVDVGCSPKNKITIYRNVFSGPHGITFKPLETTRFSIFHTLEEAIEDGKLSSEYIYTISYEVTKHNLNS